MTKSRPLSLAVWFLILAVSTPWVMAESPKPANDTPAKTALTGAAAKERIDQLRQKLAETESQLNLVVEREQKPSSSDVATPDELAENQLLLRQLARSYQREIDTLMKLQTLRQSQARLEKEAAQWQGLSSPPPYSFLLVDGLRDGVDFEKEHIQALIAMNTALEEEAARRKDALEEAREKLRQANEPLEGTSEPSPRLVWLRDMQALRNRMAEARVEGIQAEQQANLAEIAETRQHLELLERQLSEAKQKVVFAAEEKGQVRGRLKAERQRLQAELEKARPVEDATRHALEEAMTQTQNQQGGDETLELAREQAENAITTMQKLNRLLDMVKLRENIWEWRWLAQSEGGVRTDLEKIAKLREELRPVRDYLEQRQKLVGAQIFDMEKQLLDPSNVQKAEHDRKLREIYIQRQQIYDAILGGIDLAEHLLGLWRQDMDDKQQTESWVERGKEWLDGGKVAAANVWTFELFAVEDTVFVDGQAVTITRSVTLGKVLTALLILIVGLWLSGKIAQFAEGIAIRRAGMEPCAAHIAKRWLMFLVGVVLLMISMVTVKIPLTVFAFTGGAVAIGAGFGMQNLLKNLISGLMLLIERPFKPGDLVEVAGIRGRVMDIGMRSSHIRDGNGIETLIPNSTFIEENVTNWTLSSRSVRIAVRLGVAYGTEVSELTDLLLEVAGRHGLVQDKPPPAVEFEDFGADALQFALYVWVEIKPGVDWRTIASDLRFMLHKTLNNHGIVMAFPQRDIHLDATQPLEVRVLKDA